MRHPNVHPDDYIDFLIATPKVCSATEAARVQPDRPDPPAHDAFTRRRTRLEPDPDTLWAEARSQVDRAGGVLVVDDSTLDKPYPTTIALVTRHWSGTHRAVVRGINRVSLLWTAGDRHLPCDDRVYEGSGGLTKNDHFGDLIRAAYARGFRPRCVVLDGWYAGLENLKRVRHCGWVWRTRLKANRTVRIDHGEAGALGAQPVAASGTVVWRPGFGEVRVLRVVALSSRP